MDQYENLINEIQHARKHIEDAPKDTPYEILDTWLQELNTMSLKLREYNNTANQL